jgi:hypothetical protein
MSELLEKAISELTKLPTHQQDVMAAWILERLSEELDDAEWDAAIVTDALGDALLPDGNIDFDKLDARGKAITLEELYPEADDPNESG